MASKVYNAVICILLCSAICILGQLHKLRHKACIFANEVYRHGSVHRFIHDDFCIIRYCTRRNMRFVRGECRQGSKCYPEDSTWTTGGVKYKCIVYNQKPVKI
ncbi:hypothetical protein PoB_005215800 [Plakobranchus ocellatus]|uniref:Secreted protein n=1 Tax=Plakobranchus ocellatus TaxID=259542 RepID=A0AAV4C2L9_9GAST|nr:hypothetical protein PoB_005215800 [Plakobranchus ocellatus]